MGGSRMKTIAIAAAGTGGHVFPALALAEALIAAGYQVIWLGSEHGLDARLIPSTSIPFLPLPMKGVRRRSLLGWIKMPLLLGSSVWKAWRILKKNQAKGVIVFGGYVSVPAGIAAFLSRLPLWIHEQNAIAGLSNRILSPIAQKIYCGFEGAFVGQKVAVVGNPIRSNLLNLPDKSECPASPLHLLVMGGSG
ncbi:MAG: hypothetical protein EBX40_02470 [Gammaproteobacteria bacterium]|nr:hypothetical protein [Gammaproteobacteria bacterium]